MNVAATIATIANWLTSRARLIDDTGKLDQAIIDQLRAAGLPIVRYTTHVPSLHPQVDGFSTYWEKGKGLRFSEHRGDPEGKEKLRNSPISKAFDEGRRARYRLTAPPKGKEYPILADLRENKLTDYVVLPLPFGGNTHKAMTFATDAPAGFDDAQVAVLYGLAPALAATIETRYLRHLAAMLMDTYVGPVAGRKVLEGAIKRGSSETIRAVIWFCDLKGFTALSESVPGPALLETLNSYFDVMTTAIEAGNGEVLKFIGDAILAIFQPGEDGDAAAAARALAAAQAAVRGLEAVNDNHNRNGHDRNGRGGNGRPLIECGIALHFGDVLYGNVGGRQRLDFTVIGPAVNLTSRIESLTREMARPVLVSAPFAGVHGGAFEDLGRFSFKGIAGKAAVFAPACGGAAEN